MSQIKLLILLLLGPGFLSGCNNKHIKPESEPQKRVPDDDQGRFTINPAFANQGGSCFAASVVRMLQYFPKKEDEKVGNKLDKLRLEIHEGRPLEYVVNLANRHFKSERFNLCRYDSTSLLFVGFISSLYGQIVRIHFTIRYTLTSWGRMG